MDIVFLLTRPMLVVDLLFLACVRSVGAATLTWWQLVKALISFHADLIWKVVLWTAAFILLPVRMMTALQREKTIEMHLHEMQILLENLAWENKELEERMQTNIKEKKVLETLCGEMEVEHEKAISRIKLLENEMQILKKENLRLKEVRGKLLRDNRSRGPKGENANEGIPVGSKCSIPPRSTGYVGSGMILGNIERHGDSWGKGGTREPSLLKYSSSYPFSPSRNIMVEDALERGRVAALYRSVFSAVLSLLVGMIIWEAEDPCMPLVAALFMVVGMSLSSVVQFFLTIKNKPASDAVILLSVNWFILGTLTSPSLPIVARILAPSVIRLSVWFISSLGFSS